MQWLSAEDRHSEPGGRIGFAISAMMSTEWVAACRAVAEPDWVTFDEEQNGTVRQWAEVDFVPSQRYEHKHSRPLRYVGLRILKPQGSLFADGSDRHYHAVVSNLDWDAARLLEWQREKAGTVEHVHDELTPAPSATPASILPGAIFRTGAPTAVTEPRTRLTLRLLTSSTTRESRIRGLGEDFVKSNRLRGHGLICNLSSGRTSMTKKISFFVVTVAAVTLVLSGCGKGPAPDMDDDMEMPILDGTWVFAGFSAMIDGAAVTVTVGDGMRGLSTDPASPYAAVTQIVVKGTLGVEGTAYKLTLSEEDDPITVTPDAVQATVVPVLKGAIETAQDGDVMITVDVDADTITVTGSFLDTLLGAFGMQVPEGGLVGCKRGAACMTAP